MPKGALPFLAFGAPAGDRPWAAVRLSADEFESCRVLCAMAARIVRPVAGRLGEMFPASVTGQSAGPSQLLAAQGCAGHATGSTASHGATATALGVIPAIAMTSRLRWD